MKILKDKKGESYIYLCVIVIFISMLVSVLILYMGLTAQVQAQKRDTKAKLDGFISDYSVEMFNSLKQGQYFAEYIDWGELETGAMRAVGFPNNTDTEYIYKNGVRMERPEIVTLSGNGFGVKISYTACFPIEWNGTRYADLRIPMTVTSYYKFK